MAAGKRALVIEGPEPDDKFPVPPDKGFIIYAGEEVPRVSDFLVSPELREVGMALVDNCRVFAGLADRNFEFLWKRAGGKSKGRAVLGRCVKPSGLTKHYACADWIVWAAADHARDFEMTYWQVEALLFHELKHCLLTTNSEGLTVPGLRGHDWEGFVDEVERYGCWRPEMRLLGDAFGHARQLALFG